MLNVSVSVTIIMNSLIWIMFFCFIHTVRFWSIFTFILSCRKNKYQIQSYTTSNMDDFKTICIYENLLVLAYFLKKREDLFRFFGKSNIFKYISTCQTRS